MSVSETGRRVGQRGGPCGEAPKVILIGGTSHAGKSSVARALASRLGYEALSTDQLARHPGRPWRHGEAVPPHVVEHYSTLAPEALIASVMRHYDGMWPMVRELIVRRAADAGAGGLVLEGSALLPAHVAELSRDDIAALWLTADEALLAARMRVESRYDEADADGRALIDAFRERTRRYQRLTLEAVQRLDLPQLEVHPGEPIEAVADRTLALVWPSGS
jgi:2-phosphoglycerate kinase